MVKIILFLIIIALTFGATIPGDVNLNGKFNVIDLTITSHIIQNRYNATPFQLHQADVDGNSIIDKADLDLMARRIMHGG